MGRPPCLLKIHNGKNVPHIISYLEPIRHVPFSIISPMKANQTVVEQEGTEVVGQADEHLTKHLYRPARLDEY
jgi:hypothetical protein